MSAVSKKRSLRKQIYVSYLGIVAIGVIIFAVATFVTSQLKDSSSTLANDDIPHTVAILKTQVGLNSALASLRGWIAIRDNSLREENNQAWNVEILPAISLLENILLEQHKPSVTSSMAVLKQELIDLKEWHWYITEAAISDGNLPAQLHFQQYVIPIYHDIRELLVKLVELTEPSAVTSRQSHQYVVLVNMLDTIAEAQSKLGLFTHNGDIDIGRAAVEAQSVFTQYFKEIKSNSKQFGKQHGELIDQLEKQFNGYHIMVEQVIALRSDENWHLANSWLRNHALPLSRSIQENLDRMLASELSIMKNTADSVIDIEKKALWLFLLLLITMLFSALLLARFWTKKLMHPIQALVKASNELAKGNLDYLVETGGNDEISDLAHSFDSMRLALNKREQQLISSETQLRTSIATVLDAIIVIDAKGIIQSLNPAACRLFQYQEEALLGQNVKVLMPEPYKKEHDGYLSQYQKTNEAHIIGTGREVMGLRADNSEFPADLAVNKMNIDGQQQFVGLIRDITEQKKVDKMKSEFISVVSHELRTPLTSIRGSLGLLSGGAAGEVNNKFKKMLDIAVRNTDRLIRLINDILDIEKIESGKIVLKKQIITVADFLQHIIHDNEGMASSHEVILALAEFSHDIRIEADSDRINQVVTNLISNAIKYSPKGGTVTINAELSDDRVSISVADNGPGIPDDFISKIFQKFNQADSSTTREKGGTGLGLSIAKALVEQHDGEIDFETSSSGTRFYFTLAAANQTLSNDISVSTELDSKERILICEDDPDVATLLSMLLKEQGYDSDKTYSAEEALSVLATRQYDALLLDLNLPGKSGLSLIQELREKDEISTIPIIVVSAIANEVKQSSEMEAFNVIDWLEKPINVKRLSSVLKSISPVMTNQAANILYVEDDDSLGQIVVQLLDDTANVRVESTVNGARETLAANKFDLVILDMQLPDGSGLDLIPQIKALSETPPPIIVFSAQELPQEFESQVAVSFVKANSSNDSLVDAIRKQLNSIRRRD